MIDVSELEKALLSKLDGEFTEIIINYNYHAINYTDAKEWLESGHHGDLDANDDFVSAEERQLAIEKNSIWSIQIYPNTPVGSYTVAASTLQACVDFLMRDEK